MPVQYGNESFGQYEQRQHIKQINRNLERMANGRAAPSGPSLAGPLLVGLVAIGAVVWASNRQKTAPAGWYTDPEDTAQLRYWDGAAWTEHRHSPKAQGAPPGWYTDPQDPGQLRYWDGAAWTEHLHRP